jgi:uncharacterized MAPEG superfamily protein
MIQATTMTTAYWCVLVAALLPFLFTGLAKLTGPGFNNYKPRDFQAGLTGWRQRAHWAHLNSFEAFPPFAAAVIVAHLAGAPQDRIDLLALAFIACRLVYGALYIANKAPLRSLVWALGLACVIGLFVIAA